MTYQETIEYLFSQTPVFEKIGAAAYKPGLHNTHALDSHLHHPHRRFKSIHVAGTNGKGSVSHTLAAIMQAQGYRVGLYTSPHLVDFRERIRVNGECIPEQFVIDFVEQEKAFFEPLRPSFFELTTALAFHYFAKQEVDIAIVEVGLGGRMDCTNIITPELSVITNIGLDHTQFLGNTLAAIAGEKAGIIKPQVPVVIGKTQPETRPVFEATARENNAPIVFAEDHPEIDAGQKHVEGEGNICCDTVNFGTITLTLTGDCQRENANTVLHAVQMLREKEWTITDEAVREGFGHVCELTGLRGRWEYLRRSDPVIVCDTGHNVEAWQWLSEQLKRQSCHAMHIVFGMVDDKDMEGVMHLLPQKADYYFTQASTHRAIPVERVACVAKKHALSGATYNTVSAAYQAALSQAGTDDFIFIGGSSYVVADLLTALDI